MTKNSKKQADFILNEELTQYICCECFPTEGKYIPIRNFFYDSDGGFDEIAIEYGITEVPEFFKDKLDWVFKITSTGEHTTDSDFQSYTVEVLDPDGDDIYIGSDRHSLNIGWTTLNLFKKSRASVYQEEYDLARKAFNKVKENIKKEGYIIDDHEVIKNEQLHYLEWDMETYDHKVDANCYYQIDKGYEIIGRDEDLELWHLLLRVLDFDDIANVDFKSNEVENMWSPISVMNYFENKFNNKYQKIYNKYFKFNGNKLELWKEALKQLTYENIGWYFGHPYNSEETVSYSINLNYDYKHKIKKIEQKSGVFKG